MRYIDRYKMMTTMTERHPSDLPMGTATAILSGPADQESHVTSLEGEKSSALLSSEGVDEQARAKQPDLKVDISI